MHRQATRFCLVACFFVAMTASTRGDEKDVTDAPVELVIGKSYQITLQRGKVTLPEGGELVKASEGWLAFRHNVYSKRVTKRGTEIWLEPEYIWVPRYAVTSINPQSNSQARPPLELDEESPPKQQECLVIAADGDKPNRKEGRILEATDQGIKLSTEVVSRDILLGVRYAPPGERKMVNFREPNAVSK